MMIVERYRILIPNGLLLMTSKYNVYDIQSKNFHDTDGQMTTV